MNFRLMMNDIGTVQNRFPKLDIFLFKYVLMVKYILRSHKLVLRMLLVMAGTGFL